MKFTDIILHIRFFLVKHIVLLTVCFALLFFSGAIRQLTQSWFIDNGWGIVESGILNDVLFYAALIVIGCLSYLKLKSTFKDREWSALALMALYVSVISYYCFFVFGVNNIVSTRFVEVIKYAYLLYAPALGLAYWGLLGLIRVSKKWCKSKEQPKSEKENKGFVVDEPITKTDESKYPNTKEYAKKLCDNLLNTSSQEFAFAAGITGDWGSGKTSFLNLMKNYLTDENKDVIVVKFNPWMCDSPDRVVKEFFLVLKENLEIFSPFIGNYFDEYIALLLNSNDHFITKSLKLAVNENPASATAVYKKLKTDIAGIRKKIIVFIDDLDRLHRAEILATLQLIRNSATFPQISFVVAYDKAYVTQSIERNGISAAYLEKIFNVEVNLPAFDKSILLQRLSEQIKVKIELKDTALFSQIEEFISRSKPEIFQLNLKTFRDVNRFINSLKQNISSLLLTMKEKDIDINNFIALEFLRINHPKIYRILRDNRTLLLESKLEKYELKKEIDKLINKISEDVTQYLENRNPTQTTQSKEKYQKKDEPINDALDKLTKADENDAIIAILKYLFSGNAHFAVIANYSRYFVYGISANDILYDDFLLTIKNENAASKFIDWSNEDKLVALDANIRKSLYDTSLEVKDIFNGIICYAEMKIAKDIFDAEFTHPALGKNYLFGILLKYGGGGDYIPNEDNITVFLSICKEDNNLVGKSFTIYQLLHSQIDNLLGERYFTKLCKLLSELILRYFNKENFERSDFGMMYLLNLHCQKYPEDKDIISKLSKCRAVWVSKNINNVIEYTIYNYDGKEFFFDRDFATAIWGNKTVMDEQLKQLLLKATKGSTLAEYINFVHTTFEDKNNEEKYYYVGPFQHIKKSRQMTNRNETMGIIKDPSFYTLSEQRKQTKQ